jgi:hypothetical protein
MSIGYLAQSSKTVGADDQKLKIVRKNSLLLSSRGLFALIEPVTF